MENDTCAGRCVADVDGDTIDVGGNTVAIGEETVADCEVGPGDKCVADIGGDTVSGREAGDGCASNLAFAAALDLRLVSEDFGMTDRIVDAAF